MGARPRRRSRGVGDPAALIRREAQFRMAIQHDPVSTSTQRAQARTATRVATHRRSAASAGVRPEPHTSRDLRRPPEPTYRARVTAFWGSWSETRTSHTPTCTPTASRSSVCGTVRPCTDCALTCADDHHRTSTNTVPVPDTEEVTGSIPVSPTSITTGQRLFR